MVDSPWPSSSPQGRGELARAGDLLQEAEQIGGFRTGYQFINVFLVRLVMSSMTARGTSPQAPLRFPGRLVYATALCVSLLLGCVGSLRGSGGLADLAPGDLELVLGLPGESVYIAAGTSFLVEYKLTNHSHMPVCIGGSSRFFARGRPVEARVLFDGLCSVPQVIVPPGSTKSWLVKHEVPGCLAPGRDDLLEVLPELACGRQVEIQAEVTVFRLRKLAPIRGATRVVSEPALVVPIQPEAEAR